MLALIYQHQPDPSWVWDMETDRNISKVMIFPAKDVIKCTFADPNLAPFLLQNGTDLLPPTS